jgi:hypothetical protein
MKRSNRSFPMHISRSLVAIATVALLAGCGVEESELDFEGEQLDESTAEAEQALFSAKIWFTDGDGANVRSGPGTSFGIVKWLAEGTAVGIECQTTGTTINGTNIWDYVPGHGGYVTDAYVLTGYDGFIPGVPTCGAAPPPPPPPPSGTLGSAIVTKARSYLGITETGTDCNQFSAFYGVACQGWCADYARYVWQHSGANTTGLTGGPLSFYNHGKSFGTWKANVAGVVIKPGDVVVWGNSGYSPHVGIVTEVSGSTFRSIHGNWSSPGKVYETGFQNTSYQAGTGYPIFGFVTPTPK